MDKVRKSYLRMGLFLLLAGITTSSAILYFSSLREKYDLCVTVNKLKLQLNNLEGEKQKLSKELETRKALEARLVKENKALTNSIRSVQEEVIALNSAFQSARVRVKSLTSKILVLKEENQALFQQKETLSGQLTLTTQERDSLRSKFESVVELKQAIRNLKRKIHLARQEIRRKISPEQEQVPEEKEGPAQKQELQKAQKPVEEQRPEEAQVAEGNRGFIVKNGTLTFPEYKVKIEVRPTFDADAQ